MPAKKEIMDTTTEPGSLSAVALIERLSEIVKEYGQDVTVAVKDLNIGPDATVLLAPGTGKLFIDSETSQPVYVIDAEDDFMPFWADKKSEDA